MTGHLAGRYWASLTGRDTAVRPLARGRDGYSFGRRYFAALLGISLPPTPPTVGERRLTVARRVRSRRKWSLATGVTLGALASAFAVVLSTGPPQGAGTDPPDVSISFSQGDTNTVPQCTTITGSGTVPSEGAAVLMIEASDGSSMDFGARVEFNGAEWRAGQVVIGAVEDAGQHFDLLIYAVTPELADKLAANEAPDNALVDPPARLLASMSVVREDDPGRC